MKKYLSLRQNSEGFIGLLTKLEYTRYTVDYQVELENDVFLEDAIFFRVFLKWYFLTLEIAVFSKTRLGFYLKNG